MVKLATYQVKITSPQTGNVLFIIPLVSSFGIKFSREINAITPFALTLPYRAEYEDKLNVDMNPDTIVDIYRTDPDNVLQLEASFLTRTYNRIATENDDRIIISGLHVNDLLRRRYIDPADDSVQPNGGYATKAGESSAVLRAYIREQAADLASTDRQTIGLTVPIPSVNSVDIGGNFRYENLWQEMIKLANTAQLDIEVQHLGNRQFECIITQFGTNKSANNISPPYTIFDPDLGNLADPHYSVERKNETTFLRIQGAGARTNRTSLELPSASISDSVYNRIEETFDARGTNDDDPYTRYIDGLKELKNREKYIQFEGTPLLTTGGAIYRQNWLIGDTVTVRWGQLEKDIRIRRVDFEATENDETLKVNLNNE